VCGNSLLDGEACMIGTEGESHAFTLVSPFAHR